MYFSLVQNLRCFVLFSHVQFFDKVFFILPIQYTFPLWWPKRLWCLTHLILQTTVIWSRGCPGVTCLPTDSSEDVLHVINHGITSALLITPQSHEQNSKEHTLWCQKDLSSKLCDTGKVVHLTHFIDEKNKAEYDNTTFLIALLQDFVNKRINRSTVWHQMLTLMQSGCRTSPSSQGPFMLSSS